jgi:hypothetical protein
MKDPDQRHSADQLLQHEWLKDAESHKATFIKEFSRW